MAENEWEAYKEKWGPPLAEQQEHGIIAPVERSLSNMWGLPGALREAGAYLTGDIDPVESGIETPTFLEPIQNWAANLPHGSVLAGLIPGTRGEALLQGAALALPAAASARGPGSLALASSHPAYSERIGALGGRTARNMARGLGGSEVPAAAVGPVRPPSRLAAPPAQEGTWTRAAQDLAEDFGETWKPSTQPDVLQEIKKSLYNTAMVELRDSLAEATGWDWLRP